MWYENPLLRTALQMALKKSNQRLVTLARTFGPNSEIYKREAGILEKGAVKKYVSMSSGVNPITGEFKPENIGQKIDIRKLNKDIFSGNISRGDLNQLLSQFAGIRVDPGGNIQKLPSDYGVKTVGKIRKMANAKVRRMGENPEEMTAEEVIDMYEEVLGFASTFETAYDAVIAGKTEEEEQELKKDPILSELWNTDHGGTRGKGEGNQLSYNQLETIRNRLYELKAESLGKALKFEKDKTTEL